MDSAEKTINKNSKHSKHRRRYSESMHVRNMPESIREKMDEVKEKEGINYSRQIRRALRFWFEHFDMINYLIESGKIEKIKEDIWKEKHGII